MVIAPILYIGVNKLKNQHIMDILSVLSSFKHGAKIDEILAMFENQLSKRTTQRYLAELVREGRVQSTGQGRATRYELAGSVDESTPYNREFLTRYRPNESYYLSPEVRRHLLHIGRPSESNFPVGTYAKKVFSKLLTDLSWNSSRLEGNTYTLLETEKLLETGRAAANKSPQETQMILNHKAAIEFLVDFVSDVSINSHTVLNLHALLSDNLLGDPAACGRLRSIAVGISRTAYQSCDVPQVVHECFQEILDKAVAIVDPYEQAFFLMVQLPYLQPFEDVNKRVSRLSANIPLIRSNLCPLSFIDVDKDTYIQAVLAIYEHNNVSLLEAVFVDAYEKSCSRYATMQQTIGEPDSLRLQYRDFMIRVIFHVVSNNFDKDKAIDYIAFESEGVVSNQVIRARVVELIDTELMALHEGSIARYKLSLSEFKRWKLGWDKCGDL